MAKMTTTINFSETLGQSALINADGFLHIGSLCINIENHDAEYLAERIAGLEDVVNTVKKYLTDTLQDIKTMNKINIMRVLRDIEKKQDKMNFLNSLIGVNTSIKEYEIIIGLMQRIQIYGK